MVPTVKTAIVYDRVNKWGGAERVLLALHTMFPDAPLYTSVYDKKTAPWAKVFPKVYTSFLQKIPFAVRNHEYFAPLMPLAFESFKFDAYDLVISVTSEAAKGIITKPETLHVCYCLTPTRYLWSHRHDYLQGWTLKTAKPFINHLEKWDKLAAHRPDVLVAISSEVKKRIKKYYKRSSIMVFPPVTPLQGSSLRGRKDYYLVVSRLVKYKKVDVVIKAFNQLNHKLVIVGAGRDEERLKSLAGENIKFAGFVTEKKLVDYYMRAKAVIFPQEEDFGIVAGEALSLGIPVIAYKQGGARDIVEDGKNGIFFNKQNEASLVDALTRFDRLKFTKSDIVKTSRKFSTRNFQQGLLEVIKNI